MSCTGNNSNNNNKTFDLIIDYDIQLNLKQTQPNHTIKKHPTEIDEVYVY